MSARVCVIAACPLDADRGSPMRIRRRVRAHDRLGIESTVLSYRQPRRRSGDAAPSRAGFSLVKPIRDLDLAARAVVHVRRHRPDVIEGHVHEGLAIALLARLVSPGSRVVYDAHGTLADELVASGHVREGGRLHTMAQHAEGWLERRADRVLAQSEHRRRDIVSHGVAADLVRVLPDAPEPELFAITRPLDRPAVTCVYTGSVEPYQGVDDILEAAVLVPGVRVVIFGAPSGPYPARAAALGLGSRVRFIDPAPMSDLPGVLADADIALAPRRYGGNIPGKLPIYQASGLPVIGTDVPGITELVDGGTGLIVPPADPTSLADAMRTLAADAELRRRLGGAARARAAALYADDALAAVLEETYGCTAA